MKIKGNPSLKKASGYLVANVLNGLIPLLLLPIFTHYLTPEEYGVIAIFQLFVVGMGSLIGASYITAAERNYFEKDSKENKQLYATGCFLLILFFGFSVIVLTCFFGNYIGSLLSIPNYYLTLSAIVSVFTILNQFRLGQWQIRGDVKKYVILQILISLLNSAFGVLLVVSLKLGADGRIFSLLIAYSICSIFSIFSIFKSRIVVVKLVSILVLKDIFRFSLPLLPHLIAVFLLTVFDRFILNMNLGLYAVGIYMVAFQLMSSIGMFSDAINKVASPMLMKYFTESDNRILFVKYFYLWFFIITAVSILAIFVFDVLIVNFLDEKYIESSSILIWLAVGHIANGIYLILLNLVYFSKRTYYLSVSTPVVSLIHIVIFYFMTNHYGIVGAGMAFSLSMILRMLSIFFISSKVINIPWVYFFKRV